MSGRIELTPEDLDGLADACRAFLAALEAAHHGISDGAEVHMQAPMLLQDALANLVAEAGGIFAKFAAVGGRPSRRVDS